jgi:tetratricopeptide (TPR) repeat protein
MGVLKLQLKSKHNLFKQAVSTANTYFAIYPKNEAIYDMRAYARFMSKDYEGSLKDYKSVLNMSSRKFSKKDYVRFANLLYLQKKMSTAQEAVDVFNEFVTKKKMTTLQSSQMLWVKSIFKIENNIPETIVQEYNDLLMSLDSKDVSNRFYIASDMAYMYYLMEDYVTAISAYNTLITYASQNQEKYSNELKSLYVERGWAKKRMGDEYGANADFVTSGIDYSKLDDYEPRFTNQQFVSEL